jgi:hypothetical protein
VTSFPFASNIEATAATDTGLCTSSSVVARNPPSFRLFGISTRSKLVDELSVCVSLVSWGTMSGVLRVSDTDRLPGSFTGQARTVELDIGVGSMGTIRLDR